FAGNAMLIGSRHAPAARHRVPCSAISASKLKIATSAPKSARAQSCRPDRSRAQAGFSGDGAALALFGQKLRGQRALDRFLRLQRPARRLGQAEKDRGISRTAALDWAATAGIALSPIADMKDPYASRWTATFVWCGLP